MKKAKKEVVRTKPMAAPIFESDIVAVYHGKQHSCRCGCAGEYFLSSANYEFAMADGFSCNEEDINDAMIEKAVKYINKHIDKAIVQSGYIYEVSLSGGKCYTLYGKEFKQYRVNTSGKIVRVEASRKE